MTGAMKGEVLEDSGAQIIDLLHRRPRGKRVGVRYRFDAGHGRRVRRGLCGNERKWIEMRTEARHGVIDMNIAKR